MKFFFYSIFSISLLSRNLNFQFSATVIAILIVYLSTDITSIIFEFVLGMVTARIMMFSGKVNSSISLMVFLVGCFSLIVFTDYYTSTNRLIVWGIPAALIVFGLSTLPQLKNNILMHLGDASYSIYLVQVFSLPLFYKVAVTLSPPIQTDILAILCLVFSTLLGSSFYILVECPLTGLTKSATKNKASDIDADA